MHASYTFKALITHYDLPVVNVIIIIYFFFFCMFVLMKIEIRLIGHFFTDFHERSFFLTVITGYGENKGKQLLKKLVFACLIVVLPGLTH